MFNGTLKQNFPFKTVSSKNNNSNLIPIFKENAQPLKRYQPP